GTDDSPTKPGFFRSVANTFAVAVGKNPPVESMEEVVKLHKRAAWLRAVFAGLGVVAGLLTMWGIMRSGNSSDQEPESEGPAVSQ
nr:3A [Oscivirus A2]